MYVHISSIHVHICANYMWDIHSSDYELTYMQNIGKSYIYVNLNTDICANYMYDRHIWLHFMSGYMLTYMQNIRKSDIMLSCATHYVYKYVFAALDRVSALLHGLYSDVERQWIHAVRDRVLALLCRVLARNCTQIVLNPCICFICKGLDAHESAIIEYDLLAGRVGEAIIRNAISRKWKQLKTLDFTGTWKSSRATSGSDRKWVRSRPLPVWSLNAFGFDLEYLRDPGNWNL